MRLVVLAVVLLACKDGHIRYDAPQYAHDAAVPPDAAPVCPACTDGGPSCCAPNVCGRTDRGGNPPGCCAMEGMPCTVDCCAGLACINGTCAGCIPAGGNCAPDDYVPCCSGGCGACH